MTIQPKDIITAENIIEKYNLNIKKTIFLSPFANALNWKILSANFWSKLADKLTQLGYDVVFNGDKFYDSSYYNGYKNVFLSNSETIALTNQCYTIIGFRSGFTDVLASSIDAKMLILYPNDNDYKKEIHDIARMFIQDKNKSFAQNYISWCSLKDMFNKPNIDEIIINKNEDDLIDYLLKNIIIS